MESRHDLYVGQDVVCIDASQPAYTHWPSELVKGAVYKIRWLGMYTRYVDGTYLGVRLEGVNRGVCPEWGDVDLPFRASRFRPVVKDPLAVLRNLAVDPGGYKPDAPEEPRRVRVVEKEKENV